MVTLRCLATWSLGPKPTEEALVHELITRRCKLLTSSWLSTSSNPYYIFLFVGMAIIRKIKGRAWLMKTSHKKRKSTLNVVHPRGTKGRLYPRWWRTIKPRNFPDANLKAHLLGFNFILYRLSVSKVSWRSSKCYVSLVLLTNMSSIYTSTFRPIYGRNMWLTSIW